jgi:hypothetical protein
MLSNTWQSAALFPTSAKVPDVCLEPTLPLDDSLQVCNIPCTALFDLCDVELEQVVKPCDEFLSSEVVMLVAVREDVDIGAWCSRQTSPSIAAVP